jgi:hypothetical protein
MTEIQYDTKPGCLACGAPHGQPHSLACSDSDEFDRRETQREAREHDASMAQMRLISARGELEAAMAIAQSIAVNLVANGTSEVQAAQMVGIDRMTLRKALGKR